jgi:hypothetical protein
MSFITQWLANDLIKEMLKQVSCYAKDLKSLGLPTQYAPLLYIFVGVKAVDVAMSTASSIKENLDKTKNNLVFLFKASRKSSRNLLYFSKVLMDESPIKIKVLTDTEFNLKKEVLKDYVNKDSEIFILQQVPLEYAVSERSTLKLKNFYATHQGIFDAIAQMSMHDFKDGVINLKFSNKSGQTFSFQLKFR